MPPLRLKQQRYGNSPPWSTYEAREIMNNRNTGAIEARRWLPLEYDLAPRQLARFPRDTRLRDDSKVRLQELRSLDRQLLKAFFAGCSREALRYRFLSSIKGPSDRQS